MKHLDEYSSLTEMRTFSILYALAATNGEPMMMNSLRSIVPNYQTLRERIRMLYLEGLVTVETVYEPRKTTWVTTTPKGIVVGSMIVALNDQMGVSSKDNVLNYRFADFVLRITEAEPRKVSWLYQYVGNGRTLTKLLDALKDAGLVTTTLVESAPRDYTLVDLTPDGRRVAATLDRIYNIISKGREPYDDPFRSALLLLLGLDVGLVDLLNDSADNGHGYGVPGLGVHLRVRRPAVRARRSGAPIGPVGLTLRPPSLLRGQLPDPFPRPDKRGGLPSAFLGGYGVCLLVGRLRFELEPYAPLAVLLVASRKAVEPPLRQVVVLGDLVLHDVAYDLVAARGYGQVRAPPPRCEIMKQRFLLWGPQSRALRSP